MKQRNRVRELDATIPKPDEWPAHWLKVESIIRTVLVEVEQFSEDRARYFSEQTVSDLLRRTAIKWR